MSFEKETMSLAAKQEDPAVMLKGEGKLQKQQMREEDLEHLQRRQSVIYESAKQQVAVIENLLKNAEPGWCKILTRDRVSEKRPPPQAYLFKDIYEQKKQQLLQQQQEQERAQRQFRSRPMPDFSQAHRQLFPKNTVHRITCAITPNVLKTSCIMLQKRNQKIQQLKKQRDEELRQQQVGLKTKPSNIRMHLEDRPFPLWTELRAEQRKIFHVKMHEAQEARRREKEEQRQRLEREDFHKNRQMATFRARPNPFKVQLGERSHKSF